MSLFPPPTPEDFQNYKESCDHDKGCNPRGLWFIGDRTKELQKALISKLPHSKIRVTYHPSETTSRVFSLVSDTYGDLGLNVVITVQADSKEPLYLQVSVPNFKTFYERPYGLDLDVIANYLEGVVDTKLLEKARILQKKSDDVEAQLEGSSVEVVKVENDGTFCLEGVLSFQTKDLESVREFGDEFRRVKSKFDIK